MKIYHGHPSPASIEKAREAAPLHTHGAEWSPPKMTKHDWPYILDNGAFRAFKNGYPWDQDGFVRRLTQLPDMPRKPDFVVLPDVVANPEATIERSRIWAELLRQLEIPMAFSAQDGMCPEDTAIRAGNLGCEAVFVGGTATWKRRHAKEIIDECHERDLLCHVARPGSLKWAKEIGVDSIDTTSIVQSGSWDRLENLDSQKPLPVDSV